MISLVAQRSVELIRNNNIMYSFTGVHAIFLTTEVLLISDNIVLFLLGILNPRTVTWCDFQ